MSSIFENDTKVPNLNTFSTLIDRLIIERVKLAQIEDKQNDYLEDIYLNKINLQNEIIEKIKENLLLLLGEIFITERYRYFNEQRTFKMEENEHGLLHKSHKGAII